MKLVVHKEKETPRLQTPSPDPSSSESFASGIVRRKALSYGVNALAAAVIYLLFLTALNQGWINNYYRGILVLIGINAIMAVSLNLATGLLGELCLGHAGFMAVGAYTAAIYTMQSGLPSLPALIIGLLLGALTAAAAAVLVGIPALRLRGDYLAIITLAFGEMITILIRSFGFTGGARGLNNIPLTTNFSITFAVLILTVYSVYALIRSRQGRAILAIREDDIAAEASGINTTRTKITAFVISAAFAGIAGGLYAHYQGILAPERFNYDYSINFMVMVVFGGMGSITGSILSAIVLTILPEILLDFADYRMLIYALALIGLMIFRPSGLLGREEISQNRIKRLFARIFRRPLPPLITSVNTVITGQSGLLRRNSWSKRREENLAAPDSVAEEHPMRNDDGRDPDGRPDEAAGKRKKRGRR